MSLKWLLSEGSDLLKAPKFQTRYMKDSLKYRGAVLWNTVCYYEQEVGRSSPNDLKKRPAREFKFDTLST